MSAPKQRDVRDASQEHFVGIVDRLRPVADRVADLGRTSPLVLIAQTETASGSESVDDSAVDSSLSGLCEVVRVIGNRDLDALSHLLHDRRMPVPKRNTARVYSPHHGALRINGEDHPLIRLAADADGVVALDEALPTIRKYVLRSLRQPRTTATTAAPATSTATATIGSPGPTAQHPVPKPGPRPVTVDAAPDTPRVEPAVVLDSSETAQGIDEIDPLTDIGADIEPGVETATPLAASDDATLAYLARLAAEADKRTELAVAERNSMENRLEELRRQLDIVTSEAATATAALRADLDSAQRELRQVRADLKRARKEAPAAEAGSFPVLYADVEAQLRHEIGLVYLETIAEYEREDWPLREYSVGADFITSLDTVNVSRRKALTIAVQVITRRAAEIPARQVRQFGETDHASSARRVRFDGASAWRANIANDTAQAARFLWWEMPDGTVELGKAALHDDTELR